MLVNYQCYCHTTFKLIDHHKLRVAPLVGLRMNLQPSARIQQVAPELPIGLVNIRLTEKMQLCSQETNIQICAEIMSLI